MHDTNAQGLTHADIHTANSAFCGGLSCGANKFLLALINITCLIRGQDVDVVPSVKPRSEQS